MKEDTILGLLQADYGILCRTVCRESRYWVHSTVTVDEDKNITFDFDADSAMFRGGKDNRLISAAEAQKRQ
jgi:hypothetical protein